MNNYSQSLNDKKDYMTMLSNYEDLNLASYVNGKEENMVFGNSQNTDSNTVVTKKNCEQLIENTKNPFFNIYHWVKGEVFDIEAVSNALDMRESLLEKVGKNEKKMKNTQEDLDAAK